MARRSYTEDERNAALETFRMHGQAEAERVHGIPRNTIASWGLRYGVQSLQTKNMREANEFQKQSFAERRHKIIDRLYGVAESTLELIENPLSYETLARNSEGAERGYQPGFMPSQDKQREMTAAGIALDKAERLEKIDSDNGAAAGKSMLEKLAEQLGAMPVVDPDHGQSGGSGEPSAAALPADE